MTWLAAQAPGDTELDRVYGLTPTVHDHFRELERAIWDETSDPALLELARLRIATLVACPSELARRTPVALAAGLTEDKIRELPQWPGSPRFTARERLVLAFCESYVIDAHSVTDELCRRLNEQYAPHELSAITVAVAVFDAMSRFRTALDA